MMTLEDRIIILAEMAKQAFDDSCYWQGLYKSLASEGDYNNAVKKMVNDHRVARK